ncbi:MAG TPA: hypothetical protein VN370_11325 [Desulfitobacteriaceae bacterium]|nr:hypothetical protein [Desulfitobacteriaceae bacterium]
MRPNGYHGPHFVNDLTHPVTVLMFILVLFIGGWLVGQSWF